MKKFFSMILALLLCLSCAVFASSAADEEMIPVMVKTPESWDAPNLWAWADDGTNAFASWPGEAFKPLAEGWHYLYVPAFVQNVIVNANQGTDAAAQTEGIAVEAGKAVWITVAEDGSAEVSYEAQLRGEIPAYVEEFTVHAYVPLSWKTVNLWAWSAPDGTNAFASWPGAALSEGADGWFTGKAPVWVNSIIINGNEGTVQTEDISIEGREFWITVYEDLSYELAYEDPNKAVENVSMHAKMPADWAAPHCWAWSAPDGTNAFTSWPGEALSEGEDGWYTLEVPGWINSIIINANEGTVQTSDLDVEKGKDLWIVVSDAANAEVFYEEPAAQGSEPSEPQPTDPQPADPQPAEPQEPAQPAESGSSGVVIAVIAVAAVAAAAGILLKKKKQ